MGRGLSPLQRDILKMAWRHRQAVDSGVDKVPEWIGYKDGARMLDDLYTFEVMEEVFGCASRGPRRPYQYTPSGRVKFRQGQKISMSDTGPDKYRSASASVARAFKRLEQRGLVCRHWVGAITLTKQGAEAAMSLTVGTLDNCPQP